MSKSAICLLFAITFASLAWLLLGKIPTLFLLLKEGPFEAMLRRLEALSIRLAKGRMFLLWVGGALTLGLVAVSLFETWLSLFIGMIGGMFFPWLWISFLETRAEAVFSDQLSDSLDLLAGALRSGMSLPQALDVVSEESGEPGVRHWKGVVTEMKLGIPPDEAIGHLARRFGERPLARDLDLFSTAIHVNRSVGGNLAESASRLAETLRERQRLRGQVDSLTAQGRMSGWVVALLPLGILAALQVLDPALVHPLYSTHLGWEILGAGLALEILGAYFIARIVAIEI